MTRDRAQYRAGAPLLALLAFAFLLRIIVPTGWMPAHGALGIMPCPAAAPIPAPVATPDHAGHGAHGAAMHGSTAAKHEAPADHGEKKGCDFAPLGLAWTAPDPLGFEPMPPALPQLSLPPRYELAVGQGLAAPPPPSTGPPGLS